MFAKFSKYYPNIMVLFIMKIWLKNLNLLTLWILISPYLTIVVRF